MACRKPTSFCTSVLYFTSLLGDQNYFTDTAKTGAATARSEGKLSWVPGSSITYIVCTPSTADVPWRFSDGWIHLMSRARRCRTKEAKATWGSGPALGLKERGQQPGGAGSVRGDPGKGRPPPTAVTFTERF